MRILVLSQFFPPEVGATQNRLEAFASGLAARGHEVTVICEAPNHPQGVVHPDWRGRPLRRMRMGGFGVWYVWVWTSPEKNTKTRLGFYGSYAAAASAASLLTHRPDVVFASSPPLPVGAAGAFAATARRVPWVLDVRDLWPEFPVAVGELTNERVIAAVERLAHWLYRSASAVTTVTEPFARSIRAVVDDPGKIRLLPNGTTAFWVDGASLPADRAAAGFEEDDFVWTFGGNVGAGQGLDAAVEAAGLLGAGFRLVILGDGPAKDDLRARAAEVAPDRVEFRDQLPREQALAVLRSSDALLVSLAADPALADFVPSKLYDFCALARPVLVAAAGEPTRLSEAAGSALCVAPGDPAALAEAVTRVRDDAALRDRLSLAGRVFASEQRREAQVERLEEIFMEVAA